MRIRTSIVAVALLLGLGMSGDCKKCYLRLESSAQNFQEYFRALKEASLNPMERLVFSLMLAKTKDAPRGPGGVAGTERR